MELMTSWERKGREEGKVEVAQNMIRQGFDVKLILKATELSLEQIEKLKNEMKLNEKI